MNRKYCVNCGDKICVCLAGKSAGDLCRALEGVGFAEVRLDRCDLRLDEVKQVFSLPKRLIATCRPGRHPESRREELLKTAIASGASYVDVEVDSPKRFKTEIIGLAKRRNCQVIVSYHNFDFTPQCKDLLEIVATCIESGADVVKIACFVNEEVDNARLLGLLNSHQNLVAIGMGDLGKKTRPAALLSGSPFMYASEAMGREVVEGQLDRDTLESCLREFGGDKQ